MTERCTAFEPGRWAVIAHPEICEHSRRQLEVLKEMEVELKGGILCHLDEYKDSKACIEPSAFPVLCDTFNSNCYTGLRHTCEDLQHLVEMSASSKK